MVIPVEITHNYIKKQDKIFKTMQIRLKKPVEFSFGDTLVLYSNNTGELEVKRINSLSPVLPYPDN